MEEYFDAHYIIGKLSGAKISECFDLNNWKDYPYVGVSNFFGDFCTGSYNSYYNFELDKHTVIDASEIEGGLTIETIRKKIEELEEKKNSFRHEVTNPVGRNWFIQTKKSSSFILLGAHNKPITYIDKDSFEKLYSAYQKWKS